MWFKKTNENKITSEEYEKLLKRIIEISGSLQELHNKFKILETNYDNLRGNFNRKLSGIKKSEEEITEEKSETNIKPQVLLSPNGLPI